ncbi:MAG: hypothetical protein K6F20_12790 [Bacteroidaceae bacterium]|nr:hypothetical protein [Bacteroidaceae bacterium]
MGYLPALGHDWGATFGDYVAPTCTTGGGYHHTCQRDGCGVTELDNRDPALGHDWSDNWNTLAPTCTEQGYDWRPCTRCDDLDKTNFVAALGHTWGADYHCIRGDADCPTIDYVKADGTEGSHQAIPITGYGSDDVVMGFENGDTWYYLSGDFNLHSLRLIDRTANIILTAGCNNTILGGINVENGSLNIYTQSNRGILSSAINTHGDVHIHGGYVNAYNSSVGGDLVLGWTNTNDRFRSSSISAGGTITIAEGKALINATNESEIFYGDGTAIDVANISGKILDPKTDVLCYVGADDHAHFLNEGDYTVLTNETALNRESSPADAVQWLVVRGNVEFTGDLSFSGTTHLILLDDAVLTASSNTTYALYTERITNIYGSTKGNGRLEVTNGDLNAYGLLNIYGGDIRVSGSFKGRGTKNFSWTRPGNRIYANTYDGSAPNIFSGKAFTTDGSDIYNGTLTSAELTALAGKTLLPLTAVSLADNASNADAITKLNAVGNLDVTLSGRTIYKDGDWNTLCLPFAVSTTSEPLSGDNVEAMVLRSSDSGLQGTTLNLYFDAASTIPAGTPFIIKWNNTGVNISDPVFESVTIDATATTTVPFSGGQFVGQYDPFEINAGNLNEIILLGSNNTLGYSSEPRILHPFRAHFEVPVGNGGGVKAYQISFGDEGTETGIISIDNGKLTMDNGAGAWYDMSGRKLDGKPTQKGIYIRNGKKIIVK